ncbi:hypothetical protein ACWEPL_04140 [Nonomuraea sp. NPDC004186]
MKTLSNYTNHIAHTPLGGTRSGDHGGRSPIGSHQALRTGVREYQNDPPVRYAETRLARARSETAIAV